MATPSTIKIEGIDYAKVYKHWDGNPESMLEWLKDFNENFTKNRGNDPEYKFAQLLRFSSKYADKYNLDKDDYLGWGVIKYDDSYGEDYEYILHKDGTVSYKKMF